MGRIKDALEMGIIVDEEALLAEQKHEKEDQIVSLLEDIRQLLQELVQKEDVE